MNVGGAYGGGKAGASFDLMTFVQRPQVILRGCCWVSVRYSNSNSNKFKFVSVQLIIYIRMFRCTHKKKHISSLWHSLSLSSLWISDRKPRLRVYHDNDEIKSPMQ